MSKILNSMYIVTQSSIPSNGMFASGGLLYFTSSLGLYNLTNTNIDFIVTEFTSSGTNTWTRDTNAKEIQILLVGAGGGGGGGAKLNPATTNDRVGGGGGAGGSIAITYISSASLQGNVFTINIGAGGNGGNGASVVGGNGVAGSTGGSTSITSGSPAVTIVTIDGGAGGAGGQNNGFADAFTYAAAAGYPARDEFTILLAGMHGGGGNPRQRRPSYHYLNSTTEQSEYLGFPHAMNSQRGCAAGSGGGSISGPPKAPLSPMQSASGIWLTGVGGIAYTNGRPGDVGTGQSGDSGVSNIYNASNILGISGSESRFIYGLGTGGHGGASGDVSSLSVLNGGNGGDGGYFGAGAGGGGACGTGSVSSAPSGGRGGRGGDGYACIIEFF